MRRPGMTLLETLLALGLLGALAVASAALVGTATRGLAPATADRHWELAARAVMRRIHDDLAIGDEGSNARVQDGAFVIRTRVPVGGPDVRMSVAYRHDPVRRALTRSVAAVEEEPAPLIGEVAGFSARAEGTGWTITLRSTRGGVLTRRFTGS